MDAIDRAIQLEEIRLNSPLEDNDFLTNIDKGYIGYSNPQVERVKLDPIEHLQMIQGDWPQADYLPEDSGMTIGDIE